MPIFTVGAAGTTSSSYEVANSLRFDSASSDFLSRTPTSAGNRKTYTLSWWMKPANPGTDRQIIQIRVDTNNRFNITLAAEDYLSFQDVSGGTRYGHRTNALFRDVSAWYHFVIKVDTTQATDTNRYKIYANGVEQDLTAIVAGYTPQDHDTLLNSTNETFIGKVANGSADLNGYIAEMVLVDGTALDPTSFGEFDSVSGIWKPIDVSGLTFGTNGFHLDFEKNALTTAFVDEGHNSLTVTPSGDAQHSFEQAKINESSIKFDGTGDEITTSTNADFNLGTSNFTIEFWLYKSATMTNHSVGHTSVGNNEGHGFQIEYTSNKLGLYIWDLNDDWTFYTYEDSEAATGSWFHYAWVRNGTSFVLYKNGTAQSATTTSSASISPTTNSWAFGGHRSESSRFFNGFMDQIRISDTARYTSNFTAPTSEMTSDSNTLLLIQSKASNFIGADVSGTGNHFEESGITAESQSIDTCTNNYNVLNSLTNTEMTFTEGNLKTVRGGTNGQFCTGTFQMNSGKWYYESKLLNYSGNSRPTMGIAQSENTFTGTLASHSVGTKAYYLLETSYYQSNSATATTGINTSPATNDIYMWAFDLDNLKYYIGKNGTWYHSSDPSAGSNGLTIQSADYYSMATGPNDNGTDSTRNNEWEFNFGSPPYSISSGNSDANGHGNFEYTVPTGFYAINSKNLAEFG